MQECRATYKSMRTYKLHPFISFTSAGFRCSHRLTRNLSQKGIPFDSFVVSKGKLHFNSNYWILDTIGRFAFIGSKGFYYDLSLSYWYYQSLVTAIWQADLRYMKRIIIGRYTPFTPLTRRVDWMLTGKSCKKKN